MLWNQIDNLLIPNVENDKHRLASLLDLNFMLASQVVCEADMVLFALLE